MRVIPFESWVSEEENDIKFDPLRLLLLEILRPKLKNDSDSPVTDEYLFAHLSHEDQTVVLEWVNTLLYIKYTLLKTQNPTVADKVSFWLTSCFTKCITQDLGKLLNRYVIRQSYVTAGSIPDQLLFFVLTESRLAVFEHHLDEKPR